MQATHTLKVLLSLLLAAVAGGALATPYEYHVPLRNLVVAPTIITPTLAGDGTNKAGACADVSGCTTWDPVTATTGLSFSPDNLTFYENGSGLAPVRSKASMPNGKWYWEITPSLSSQGDVWLGLVASSAPYANVWSNIGGAHWRSEGQVMKNNVWGFPGGVYNYEYMKSGVLMFAFDGDTGKLWVGKNCTWASGNPSDGSLPFVTLAAGQPWKVSYVTESRTGNNTLTANFGASGFSCAPPVGFSAGIW